jgi:hypothetical protein
MAVIACTNCGSKVSIPEGHLRPKIRCTNCNYYTAVPEDLRAEVPATQESAAEPPRPSARAVAKPGPASPAPKKKSAPPPVPPVDQHARRARPNNHAVDTRPNFESDDPSGQYLLDGDDLERDDDQTTPYAVPGTGTKRCTECRGELPLDATLCIHCGFDLAAKQKKAKREYTPLYREWEPYISMSTRMKIFIGMQFLNLLILALAVIFNWGAGSGLVAAVMQSAMQAFLLGTFDKLVVTRTVKGKADIQRYWRVCFIPIQPQKVDWRVSHGVAIIPERGAGVFEWMMMVYLLLAGCLPGLLFYWFVIVPERYNVALCDVHGSTDRQIFRTTSRDVADDVCSVISEVTTLDYRNVV